MGDLNPKSQEVVPGDVVSRRYNIRKIAKEEEALVVKALSGKLERWINLFRFSTDFLCDLGHGT